MTHEPQNHGKRRSWTKSGELTIMRRGTDRLEQHWRWAGWQRHKWMRLWCVGSRENLKDPVKHEPPNHGEQRSWTRGGELTVIWGGYRSTKATLAVGRLAATRVDAALVTAARMRTSIRATAVDRLVAAQMGEALMAAARVGGAIRATRVARLAAARAAQRGLARMAVARMGTSIRAETEAAGRKADARYPGRGLMR